VGKVKVNQQSVSSLNDNVKESSASVLPSGTHRLLASQLENHAASKEDLSQTEFVVTPAPEQTLRSDHRAQTSQGYAYADDYAEMNLKVHASQLSHALHQENVKNLKLASVATMEQSMHRVSLEANAL